MYKLQIIFLEDKVTVTFSKIYVLYMFFAILSTLDKFNVVFSHLCITRDNEVLTLFIFYTL